MKLDPLYRAIRNTIAFTSRIGPQGFSLHRLQQAEETRRIRERDRIGAVLAGDATCRRIA